MADYSSATCRSTCSAAGTCRWPGQRRARRSKASTSRSARCTPNRLRISRATSIRRYRTTPCSARLGPARTHRTTSWVCSSDRRGFPPGRHLVAQTRQTLLVVAVYPVPQRLAIHSTPPCANDIPTPAPASAARRIRLPRPQRLQPRSACVTIHPRDRHTSCDDTASPNRPSRESNHVFREQQSCEPRSVTVGIIPHQWPNGLRFVACDISVILWSLAPIEATIVAYECKSSDGASQR